MGTGYLLANILTDIKPVLDKLFLVTGTDFTCYRPSTIRRRINRRVAATGSSSLQSYANNLDSLPGEYNLLLSSLTIKYTMFFRDPWVYSILESYLKKIIGPARSAPVTIWSAACSTGEEAYSLAALLYSLTGAGHPGARVAGTDIDPEAIKYASYGSYAKVMPSSIPQTPWSKYFIDRPNAIEPWQILRHMVEFMPMDLLSKSAPFLLANIFPGGCDVIFCRNVLIYMNREAQARVLSLCADMLRPNGLLVLGTGETVPKPSALALEMINPKARIFRKITKREALPCSADSLLKSSSY